MEESVKIAIHGLSIEEQRTRANVTQCAYGTRSCAAMTALANGWIAGSWTKSDPGAI